MDCGDLPLDPDSTAKSAAVACVRAAVAASKPFTVFWREQGVDDVAHIGIIGRVEDGSLRYWAFHTGSGKPGDMVEVRCEKH